MSDNSMTVKEQLQAFEADQDLFNRIDWVSSTKEEITEQVFISLGLEDPAAFKLQNLITKINLIENYDLNPEQKILVKRWLFANLYLFNVESVEFNAALLGFLIHAADGVMHEDGFIQTEHNRFIEMQYRPPVSQQVAYEDLVLAYAIYVLELAKAKKYTSNNFEILLASKIKKELIEAGYIPHKITNYINIIDNTKQLLPWLSLLLFSAALSMTLFGSIFAASSITLAAYCFVYTVLALASYLTYEYLQGVSSNFHNCPMNRAYQQLNDSLAERASSNLASQQQLKTLLQHPIPVSTVFYYPVDNLPADQVNPYYNYHFNLFDHAGASQYPVSHPVQLFVDSQAVQQGNLVYDVHQAMPAFYPRQPVCSGGF